MSSEMGEAMPGDKLHSQKSLKNAVRAISKTSKTLRGERPDRTNATRNDEVSKQNCHAQEVNK